MSVTRALAHLAALAASLVLQACGDTTQPCDYCEDAPGYYLQLAAPAKSPLVLFSGWREGACWVDFVCYGTTRAGLGVTDWNEPCGAQSLAVFAPERSPRLFQTHLPFGEQELAEPVRIKLSVWIDAPTDREFRRIRDDIAVPDVAHTNALFQELNVGVRLVEYTFTQVSQGDGPGSLATLAENNPDLDKCRLATSFQTELRDVSGALAYTPSVTNADHMGVINAYYVSDEDVGVGYRGKSCYNVPGVLFVSYQTQWGAELLPHEIGHALGLNKPCALEGEPNAIAGFPDATRNLMFDLPTETRSITLGQLYRIHFDADGWVRNGGPPKAYCAAALFSGQIGSPQCQNDAYTRFPCPPYTLRVPEGWR